MSTGSRAFRIASSRQFKQEVVRLLFGQKYARKGPDAHRKLDSSIYSYADLKKAYLGRIQEIHPDKIRNDADGADERKEEFRKLNEAWGKYEELAKTLKSAGNEDANFTMFGVGCSFADTEAEKDLRNEITDQACRGWFSSGLLAETSELSRNGTAPFKLKEVSLLDESLFTDVTRAKDESDADSSSNKPKSVKAKRKTLIPGVG